MTIEVGWCISEQTSSSVFFEPQASSIFTSNAHTSHSQGVSKCPAVHNSSNRLFTIKSPFTIKLKAIHIPDKKLLDIRPLYPDTEVEESRIPTLIAIEPRKLWLNLDTPILQIKMPYVFCSDSPVWINQLEAPSRRVMKSWSLIQGRFDIYSWQRPLNFAAQWFNINEDFYIKRGEPLFQISFDSNESCNDFKLRKIKMEGEIASRVKTCSGVTKLIQNTNDMINSNRDPKVKFLQ